MAVTEERVPAIIEEIRSALDALHSHCPGAILKFEQLFKERATLPCVVETWPGERGIAGALAGLFPTCFSLEEETPSFEDGLPTESFFVEMKGSLDIFLIDSGLSLILLKRHQLEKQCSMETALQVLFADYVRRGMALPY